MKGKMMPEIKPDETDMDLEEKSHEAPWAPYKNFLLIYTFSSTT